MKKKARARSNNDSYSILEVHEVGAYFVSVAETLSDLARIDPTVFQVAPDIEKLFKQHYKEGFAFIVCCFNPSKKDVKTHPVGTTIDFRMSLDSRLS